VVLMDADIEINVGLTKRFSEQIFSVCQCGGGDLGEGAERKAITTGHEPVEVQLPNVEALSETNPQGGVALPKEWDRLRAPNHEP